MSSPDPPPIATDASAPAGTRPSAASRVLHNTGVLAISSLTVRALGLGMVVVLARYLGAEGYGTYQRAEAFVFLFSIVASLGLDLILTREVARRGPRLSEYFSGVMVLKLLLAPVCLALVLGFAYARGYQGDFLWGIGCYSAVLLLTAFGSAFDGVFQGLDNMGYTAVANLVNQVAFVALGGIFVLLHKDLRWILAALVVAAIVRLIVSASLLARLPVRWVRPAPATLLYLLKQSIPIAFAVSFVVVYQQLDAVMLGDLRGKTGNEEVGWYKAGAKFLLVYSVLRESFLVALYPVFASVAATARDRMGSLVTRAVRYQLIVAFFFVLCFVFLPRVASDLLGRDFENTASVLPIMAWILVPQTISVTMGRVLVASGNQKRIMFATGLALLVNAALNLVLIPRYGYKGAAVAGAVSEVAVALANVYYVQRYVARTHILRAILQPVAAAALVGVVLYLQPGLRLYVAVPLAGVLYVAGLFALRTFSASERVQFRSLLREGRARFWKNGRGPGDSIDPGLSAGA
jgi:O-antigen/teichoic acid export membrane protein